MNGLSELQLVLEKQKETLSWCQLCFCCENGPKIYSHIMTPPLPTKMYELLRAWACDGHTAVDASSWNVGCMSLSPSVDEPFLWIVADDIRQQFLLSSQKCHAATNPMAAFPDGHLIKDPLAVVVCVFITHVWATFQHDSYSKPLRNTEPQVPMVLLNPTCRC